MEEHLKEIRDDVKEVRKMLHSHIVEEAELKAQVKYHAAWFKVMGAFIIGIVSFLVKDKFQ